MPKSLKDKVLESTDIVDVIGERVALKKRGREFIGLCPFHPDHKPSLSVNPTKQIFMCWACRTGGDVISFIQKKDGLDFRATLAFLAQRAGIEDEERADQHGPRVEKAELRRVLDWAKRWYQRNLHDSPAGRAALEYALGRGLSRETIERQGLGLAPDEWESLTRAAATARINPALLVEAGLVRTRENGTHYDWFRGRLMFPIHDGLGRPVAFGGRSLTNDPAKYMNSGETPLFSKSRILYGFDLARRAIENSRRVLVVEGYMDAVLLHQHGFMNAVATLGTALTDAHAKQLRPLVDEMILCFDGDDAGYRAADRAVELALRGSYDVRVVVMPPGVDPADSVVESGKPGFEQHLQSAVDALQFKWNRTFTSFSDRGPRGRRLAVEEFLRFVVSASASGGISPFEQALLVGRLADLLSVPAQTIHELLRRGDRSTRAVSQPQVAADEQDTSDSAGYDRAVAGLPAGIVAAVEELFGLLFLRPDCFGAADECFATAAGFAEPWRRLHAICVDAAEAEGELTSAAIQARCEDRLLIELLMRAHRRVTPTPDVPVAYAAAHARLLTELDLLRMSELRSQLGRPAAMAPQDDSAEAYLALLNVSRRQHAVLPAEAMLNATTCRPA